MGPNSPPPVIDGARQDNQPEAAEPLLSVEGLRAGYNGRVVLDGVSLQVYSGRVLAIIGHNGSGKSTLLRAVMGIIPLDAGRICFRGTIMNGAMLPRWIRSGVCYRPQGKGVFSGLTVHEHLLLAAGVRHSGARRVRSAQRMLEQFELLRSKGAQLADRLSGGEQRVLSFAMALLAEPRVMLLDEPCAGLAQEAGNRLLSQVRQYADENDIAAVVVEQRVTDVLSFADDAVVLRQGRVTYSQPADTLRYDRERLRSVFL